MAVMPGRSMTSVLNDFIACCLLVIGIQGHLSPLHVPRKTRFRPISWRLWRRNTSKQDPNAPGALLGSKPFTSLSMPDV